MPKQFFIQPAATCNVMIPLLLAAAAALPCTTALAQPTTTEDSAQGEALSPPAVPKESKGAYFSDWFNQDLTLIGSKDISFGPSRTMTSTWSTSISVARGRSNCTAMSTCRRSSHRQR